jgi:transcriptional regulator with XRE-family HTH domain
MDADIFQIADAIRIFKGLTITDLASKTKINRGNLNAWLNAGTPDRLSSDKIKKIFDYLEIDLDPLRIRPGIHRFTIPSPTTGSVSLIESVIFRFFPEGGTFYPVWEKSGTLKIGQIETDNDNEMLYSGTQWKRWVAVPKFAHDIRVIFKMGEKAKHLYHYFNDKTLSEPFMSGVCGWHGPDSRILLPDQLFARLSTDESLTVSELDKILSYSPSSDYLWTGDSIATEDQMETEYDRGWTWEAVVRRAKEAGLKPEEVAERLGLSE